MRKFGIMCLLIFVLFLSTRVVGYLAVKMDSQFQNEERFNYTSTIDSEIIEAANAKNVSVDSYLSTELYKTLIKVFFVCIIVSYIMFAVLP